MYMQQDGTACTMQQWLCCTSRALDRHKQLMKAIEEKTEISLIQDHVVESSDEDEIEF